MATLASAATVTPTPGFDAEEDSKKLRKAMKGLGTDEKAIIAILCFRTNAERQELKEQYKTLYGRDLVDDLKSELGGHFEDVIVGLMMTRPEYDAFCVRNAVKGLGTDEACLIEILCSRTNEELAAAKEVYKKKYGKSMEEAVRTDVSGDFKRLLVSLITANRDPDGPVDQAKAAKDAKDLYDAGEGKWGTDESTFNMILATRSYSHLRAMYEEYEKLAKHDIKAALVKEMSGDLLSAYLAIVGCSRNMPRYFAGRLYKSMKGAGTDDKTLVRVMVSRSEVDMKLIKEAFEKEYQKTLYSFIKGDTSGDYEKALLALLRD